MIPACGPPSSLSPLKETTETPVTQLARATGSEIPASLKIHQAARSQVFVNRNLVSPSQKHQLFERSAAP